MTTLSKTWDSRINAGGYRLTAPRQVIAEIISSSDQALTPADIFIKARSRCKGIGLVTVYRTMEKLAELGLVERVHHEDGCNSYIAHPEGHQHLLICMECYKTIHFKGEDISEFIKSVGKSSGYQIQDHWLQLNGICPDCQQQEGKYHAEA